MAASRPILPRFLRYGAGQCTRTRAVRRQCRLGHCRLSSSAAATAELDIIDVSPALHAGSSREEKLGVAHQVARACETLGFFGVQGHGVPGDLVKLAWDAAWTFFDNVNATTDAGASLRTAVQIPHGGYPYGYAPFVSESLAGSLGKVAPPDLKETYSLGPMTVPAALPDDPVAKFAFSPNLWPGTESGKQFERAMRTYYQEANLLANNLLRVFAMALDVKEDFFVEKSMHHMSALRLNNYPELAAAPQPGQLRAGEHCDYGSLTILMPHQMAADSPVGADGLQVFSQGEWRNVQVPPDTFVINIGDLMARWTNDRWQSTLHRVVVPDESATHTPRRMSLAFFHQPDWEAVVDALPSCIREGEQRRHAPTTAGLHIKEKFEAAGVTIEA